MPPYAPSPAAAGFEIDRRALTISLARSFAASREEVFEAWTRPEHVTCWWDASGDPLAACDIDLRPGGSFKFVTRSHPEAPFTGVYSEISPPDGLVFEALGATGRVTLRESAGRTRLSVEIQCRSEEHLDQFLKMGVAVGTSQTLDNLVAYIARRPRSGSPR